MASGHTPCMCPGEGRVATPRKDVMEPDPFVALVKSEVLENIQCKRVLIL